MKNLTIPGCHPSQEMAASNGSTLEETKTLQSEVLSENDGSPTIDALVNPPWSSEPPHPLRYLAPWQDEVYQAAVDYAIMGWFVFPAKDGKRGSYKSAKFSNGRKWGATNDHNDVMHDWCEWPDAGIGLVTGPESGFFVIDVDTLDGHGVDGIANFRSLVAQHGQLPDTVMAQSPTGSLHVYFKWPETGVVRNSVGGLGDGIDVRGQGGCIIAPPTYRLDLNAHYLWLNSPSDHKIAACPQWLLQLIVESQVRTGGKNPLCQDTAPPQGDEIPTSHISNSYGASALKGELIKLQGAKKGERNNTLNKCAFSLGQLVASGQLDKDEVREKLVANAKNIGLEPSEITATIDSGFESGLKSPRFPKVKPVGITNISTVNTKPNTQATSPQSGTQQPFEGPVPLVRQTPPGRPYPCEALGGLKSAVEAVAASTQAPPALAASSALAVASLCVQGFADVETLNTSSTSPLSLFFMTSAVSGERKTAAYKPFVGPVEEFEREDEKKLKVRYGSWQAEYDTWKIQRDKLQKQLSSKKSDTDISQIKADLSDLGPEPTPPQTTDRIITEPTFEALLELLKTGQPSIGIFTDEGAQFLGGHAMSSEKQQHTLAGMNKLWSGDPIKRTRVSNNNGHFALYGKRLATHLMVQPEIMRGFMSGGLSEEIGFLPRFLLCEPESKVGKRQHRRSTVDMSPVKQFGERVNAILEAPLPTEKGTTNLIPRTLKLSDDAHQLLVDFYDEVETQQKPGGVYENVSGYASKIAEQAARLAGVLTMWSDLEAEVVEEQEMRSAIVLADYYLSEAVRIGGEAEISEVTRRAEALKKWLTEKWPYDDIAMIEIMNKGPNCIRESRLAQEAMKVLEQHGWAEPLEAGTIVRGSKRKKAWKLSK